MTLFLVCFVPGCPCTDKFSFLANNNSIQPHWQVNRSIIKIIYNHWENTVDYHSRSQYELMLFLNLWLWILIHPYYHISVLLQLFFGNSPNIKSQVRASKIMLWSIDLLTLDAFFCKFRMFVWPNLLRKKIHTIFFPLKYVV